ncbi:hypothetical protein [Dehalobacter sp. TeCB1]|uniref:hypothetical protein n=1 Tax=Dehalobacter sp. TeCB1 TaxID=1843715 RepID=UPI00159F1820|nr:hypothetical protein [Dehalobacter sp. TeCB1]
MKKSKLIAGIILMVLGIGISVGSVVFHYYEHDRYGETNFGHMMIQQHDRQDGIGGDKS